MKHSENILKKNKLTVRAAAEILYKILLGTVFAYTGFGSIAPFGVAYASVSGIFGAIGSVVGYLLKGNDVFRYSIASAVSCTAGLFLRNVIAVPNELKAFLFTMWAFLIAGISGMFVSDNSFSANCLFMVGGVAGGAAAFILSVSSDILHGRKKYTAAVRFVFLCICLTAALTGIYSVGNIFKHTAFICAYFVLHCICGKFGLYISVTAASILGVIFFLTDTSLLPFLGSLLIGTVLAGIFHNFGKYGIIGSFIFTGAIITVISDGKVGILEYIPDIIFAGILYVVAPTAVINKITETVSCGITGNSIKKLIKRKKKFLLPKKNNRSLGSVCDSCRKKIICWVRDFSETTDVFNGLKAAYASGRPPEVPEYFKNKCDRYAEIIDSMQVQSSGKNGLYSDSASASTPKTGESICGDTCTSFTAEDGRQIFIITDGMGTGANAGQQSFRISSILKKLLSQGFDKNDALKIVNETMLKTPDETVMGIDIALLNEKNGECEFIKVGAAPSFIIRKGKVYQIGSPSLPIGVLDDISAVKNKCKLVEGDVVIMVSDGLISDDSRWLKDSLTSIDVTMYDPVSLADTINEKACSLGLHEKDDISITVIFLK